MITAEDIIATGKLHELPRRHRHIITDRFALNGGRRRTYQAIAADSLVRPGEIRALEKEALRMLGLRE